jgi:hypothetical protein
MESCGSIVSVLFGVKLNIALAAQIP